MECVVIVGVALEGIGQVVLVPRSKPGGRNP